MIEILLGLIFLVLIYIAVRLKKIEGYTFWTMRFIEEAHSLGDFKNRR